MNTCVRHLVPSLIAATACLGLAARPTHAELVTINNSGFEADEFDDGLFANSATGWTVSGAAGTWNPHAAGYPGGLAPEGENVAYANVGTLSQVLSTDLEANTRYTLNALVGNRMDTAFPGYTVQLWAGNTMLVQDNGSLTPDEGTFDLSAITFTTGATHAELGNALQIILTSVAGQTNFDDIQLDATAVPEPASMLLCCVGLCGCGVASRRRRRHSLDGDQSRPVPAL